MTQIAVNGQIWSYTEIGGSESNERPQGSPLLVLHGWGRNGNEWVMMGQDLSSWSGRKVYILDLPGFGGSSLPKVKTITEYSQLVVEFCKYMEIEKTIIIGHSLGGRVGIVLSAKYPDLIERLVLVDPAGVKPKSVKRVLLKVAAKLFAWVPASIRAKMIGRVMDEDYRNTPQLRDLYRAVVGEDLTKYLSKIKCGCLVVWGENDPILPLALTKIYRSQLSDVQIRVIWGAGHDPHLTKYEQTLSVLQEACE